MVRFIAVSYMDRDKKQGNLPAGHIAAATLFRIRRGASNCGCFPVASSKYRGPCCPYTIQAKLTSHMPSHARHENETGEEAVGLLIELWPLGMREVLASGHVQLPSKYPSIVMKTSALHGRVAEAL